METLKKFNPIIEKSLFSIDNIYKSKEEREYLKNYCVYCSLCDCKVSRCGWDSHLDTKKHNKNYNQLKDKENFIEISNKTKTINKNTNEEVIDNELCLS